ncbi:hypothetical protein ACIQGZ_28960 [Streptomyces sp. NPDC092296]|uniref:hypothetical protein n=1 Tax=Streptomyces sp. NPDC092296 TaxID=3366012 RepID=UPI00381FA0BA
MTQQGEGTAPHRDPAQAGSAGEGGPRGHARSRRRGSPRLWAAVSFLLVGSLAVVLWMDRSGESLLGGFGDSQDAAGTRPTAGAAAAPTGSAAPDGFAVEQYFPAKDTLGVGTAKAARSAAQQGTDCAKVVTGRSASRVRKIGCAGYIGATYTRTDGEVFTTVTVLRFKDDTSAREAAEVLTGNASDVAFVLPETTATDEDETPPPVMPPANARFSRVAAVRSYVTVTSSAFRDGHQPTAVDQEQLAQATRTVAHAAGSQFVWL